MTPRHHPSAEILTAYVAGAHDPGFALVVAAHVEGCARCRKSVAALQAASGQALRSLPDSELSSDAFEKVMARLETRPEANAPPDTRPLLERLPLKPRKWVGPGVWVAAVDTPHEKDNRVYVLSVAPGALTARHEHSGMEFCAVLKGAYRDETGLFAAGDFASADNDLNHQPLAVGDEACVCLFATEGRLRPQGVLGRLAFAYANV